MKFFLEVHRLTIMVATHTKSLWGVILTVYTSNYIHCCIYSGENIVLRPML